MSRHRAPRGSPSSSDSLYTKDLAQVETKHETAQTAGPSSLITPGLYHLLDLGWVLGLVFGGCCANVWSYEELLRMSPRIGSALTFSQMLFISLQALPSFVERRPHSLIPRLKPPHVPLRRWSLQVILLTAGSLLNNWVFKYNIPLTVQIVFRSAGLAVSMLFGYIFRGKKYSTGQVASVLLVSAGVVLSALSKPQAAQATSTDNTQYAVGIVMLVASLVLSGMLGTLQEQTYQTYGPYWKEGVFYTHALSLPIFIFLISDIQSGLQSLSTTHDDGKLSLIPYAVLLGNLVTQAICVSGVNQLTSRVSSVSTNLALTVRKALSLCFSVWYFGSGWNARFGSGAGMVFSGSFLYALFSRGPDKTSAKGVANGVPKMGNGKRKAKVA